MKKVVVMLISIVLLTGCRVGKLTFQDMKDRLGDDYLYEELPINGEYEGSIDFLAYANSTKFVIFYYDLKTESDAKTLYDSYVKSVEDENTKGCIIKTKDKVNYKKYTSVCNGKYNVVIKNKDIMLNISTDEINKDDVNKAIEKLGY